MLPNEYPYLYLEAIQIQLKNCKEKGHNWIVANETFLKCTSCNSVKGRVDRIPAYYENASKEAKDRYLKYYSEKYENFENFKKFIPDY